MDENKLRAAYDRAIYRLAEAEDAGDPEKIAACRRELFAVVAEDILDTAANTADIETPPALVQAVTALRDAAGAHADSGGAVAFDLAANLVLLALEAVPRNLPDEPRPAAVLCARAGLIAMGLAEAAALCKAPWADRLQQVRERLSERLAEEAPKVPPKSKRAAEIADAIAVGIKIGMGLR